jgi:hypothetical protein
MKTLSALLFVSLAAHGQTKSPHCFDCFEVQTVSLPKPAPSRVVKPHVVPVDLSSVIPAPPVAIVRKVQMPKPAVPVTRKSNLGQLEAAK